MIKRGRKRIYNREEILEYALSHPDTPQRTIAAAFGTTQCRVSLILRESGISTVTRRGRPLSQHKYQTDEQFFWEKVLHDLGLGMDRGLRIQNKRILYGYDPMLSTPSDYSATLI